MAKICRIFKDETVIYSQEYTRVTKRISHVVWYTLAGINGVASIKFYLVEKSSKRVFAVAEKIEREHTVDVESWNMNHLMRIHSTRYKLNF